VVKLLDYAAQDEVLARDANPFATVVQAHLKTLQTRQDLEGRRVWKVRLVRSLYEGGYPREGCLPGAGATHPAKRGQPTPTAARPPRRRSPNATQEPEP